MCVIVTAPAGAMPTTTQLALMSEANPDGAGIAWYDGQRLRRYRHADNHKTLGFIITNHQALAAMPFLLHFRLATHGEVAEENTHPFAYKRNGRTGYIAHNGIAQRYTHGPHASDSRNAINAWEHGRDDFTDGSQGKFALIDQDGRIEWLAGGQDIEGERGTFQASNTNWTLVEPDDPYGIWQEAWDDGYRQGAIEAGLDIPDYVGGHRV